MRRARESSFANASPRWSHYLEAKAGVARLERVVDAARSRKNWLGIWETACMCGRSEARRCGAASSSPVQRSRAVNRSALLFVGVLPVVAAASCDSNQNNQNVCAIEGAAPEWTRQ